MELKNPGWVVNKKKAQRLVQVMGLQVPSCGREYKKYSAYQSRQELARAIERVIRYYNNDRIKEKLGGLSPKEYRERMNAA